MSTPHSVPAAFRRQAARTPDAVALADGTRQLSYAELDSRADALARLLAEEGVRPGDRVAVCLERSVDLVVALLGVLKAGAAYLPLTLTEAPARLSGMLTDAGVELAVCDAAGARQLAGQSVRTVSELPGPTPAAAGLPAPGAEDLACLMYTSGSTGRPKGVMVPHRSVVNLVTEPNYVTLGPGDRILQLAPVAFDAATFEIWGALLNGARVEVPPHGPVGPAELTELLLERGITVLWLTAALFHRQIDSDAASLGTLRTVLAGGDVLSTDHVRRLRAAAPALEIVNGYGPTEATTFSLCHRIAPDEEFTHSVPIGTPLQGAVVELRAADGTPAADGDEGELWVGGAGVSLGYWQRPELTAERFVADADGRLWYRTGDLVRRRADGAVEFLGRIDGQFKLHGQRVEPGEIENVLAEHPEVRQAAVAVRTNHLGDLRLVAWLTTVEETLNRRALRAFLRERLPDHMVPALFATVDELPVTTNGKVDRKALPDPDWKSKALYL
ncbi:amino acid adenylation domain-containing protein [Kitasatospora sp. McL0602]|uniref:amino acid adenylation domain-containing protein n=1 Tax=Kitasatospora sp. McL0602 TaxID=3439530 RepID=UPI003F8897B9